MEEEIEEEEEEKEEKKRVVRGGFQRGGVSWEEKEKLHELRREIKKSETREEYGQRLRGKLN